MFKSLLSLAIINCAFAKYNTIWGMGNEEDGWKAGNMDDAISNVCAELIFPQLPSCDHTQWIWMSDRDISRAVATCGSSGGNGFMRPLPSKDSTAMRVMRPVDSWIFYFSYDIGSDRQDTDQLVCNQEDIFLCGENEWKVLGDINYSGLASLSDGETVLGVKIQPCTSAPAPAHATPAPVHATPAPALTTTCLFVLQFPHYPLCDNTRFEALDYGDGIDRFGTLVSETYCDAQIFEQTSQSTTQWILDYIVKVNGRLFEYQFSCDEGKVMDCVQGTWTLIGSHVLPGLTGIGDAKLLLGPGVTSCTGSTPSANLAPMVEMKCNFVVNVQQVSICDHTLWKGVYNGITHDHFRYVADFPFDYNFVAGINGSEYHCAAVIYPESDGTWIFTLDRGLRAHCAQTDILRCTDNQWNVTGLSLTSCPGQPPLDVCSDSDVQEKPSFMCINEMWGQTTQRVCRGGQYVVEVYEQECADEEICDKVGCVPAIESTHYPTFTPSSHPTDTPTAAPTTTAPTNAPTEWDDIRCVGRELPEELWEHLHHPNSTYAHGSTPIGLITRECGTYDQWVCDTRHWSLRSITKSCGEDELCHFDGQCHDDVTDGE